PEPGIHSLHSLERVAPDDEQRAGRLGDGCREASIKELVCALDSRLSASQLDLGVLLRQTNDLSPRYHESSGLPRDLDRVGERTRLHERVSVSDDEHVSGGTGVGVVDGLRLRERLRAVVLPYHD